MESGRGGLFWSPGFVQGCPSGSRTSVEDELEAGNHTQKFPSQMVGDSGGKECPRPTSFA